MKHEIQMTENVTNMRWAEIYKIMKQNKSKSTKDLKYKMSANRND